MKDVTARVKRRLAVALEDAADAADAAVASGHATAPIGAEPGSVAARVATVMGSLASWRSPSAEPNAETCFALTAYVLETSTPVSGLLDDRGRVPGDRSVTDHLARDLLRSYGIPASRGSMQSSTLRAGYEAAHARGSTVATYVEWLDDPTTSVSDRAEAFKLFAETFMAHQGATTMVFDTSSSPMPHLRFTAALDELLAVRSNGALQQYLLAALLEATHAASGVPVTTKTLFAADAVTSSAGDIVVGDATTGGVIAYEVSASSWQTKLGQALDTLSSTPGCRVVIAASVPGGVTSAAVAAAVAAHPGFDGDPTCVDLAVVDIAQLCASLAAGLSGAQLTGVLRRACELVAEFASTRTDLLELIAAHLPRPAGAADGAAGPPARRRPRPAVSQRHTAEQLDLFAVA